MSSSPLPIQTSDFPIEYAIAGLLVLTGIGSISAGREAIRHKVAWVGGEHGERRYTGKTAVFFGRIGCVFGVLLVLGGIVLAVFKATQ